jgi:hypothetical protein
VGPYKYLTLNFVLKKIIQAVIFWPALMLFFLLKKKKKKKKKKKSIQRGIDWRAETLEL